MKVVAGPYIRSAPKGSPADVERTINCVVYATGLISRVVFFAPNVDKTQRSGLSSAA